MPADLLRALRLHGPLQAGEVLAHLGLSRASLMRRVRAAGEAVIVRGKARRTTYAARRPLRGSLVPMPLFRVDPAGEVEEIARLDLIHPAGCAVEFLADFGWPLDPAMQSGWFGGLPYPLQDMRPQGFVGRNFARHHASLLQVAQDPTAWSDDDALHAMSLLGADLLGDLIVGEPSCRQWLDRRQDRPPGQGEACIDDGTLEPAYIGLAERAMAQGLVGSSAGGEFPKFEAARRFAGGRVQPVLVKFSGSDASPGSGRWADLLVCEHLAGALLRTHLGIDAAVSRVLRFGGRTFLEVERFDRHGPFGRSGASSWSSLNGALFGLAGVPWVEAARHLAARGWLSAQDSERIARLWHFGTLIGNTDMHDGNLSFQPARIGGQPGVRPAPAYDMLPMAYAPAGGLEVRAHALTPSLPLPAQRAAWTAAAGAALAFWESAAGDARIGAAFRRVCELNAAGLRALL